MIDEWDIAFLVFLGVALAALIVAAIWQAVVQVRANNRASLTTVDVLNEPPRVPATFRGPAVKGFDRRTSSQLYQCAAYDGYGRR